MRLIRDRQMIGAVMGAVLILPTVPMSIGIAGSPLCPADMNGDCDVGPFDLAFLLGGWGPCPDPCEPGEPQATCQTDLNGDCNTGPFDLALVLGDWGGCAPVHDDCEGAIEIFDGDTELDISCATTGGPAHAGCGFKNGLPRLDIWFTYTATCSGLLRVSTCNQASFDTTLVIYDGCECPATDEQFVVCNDDVCSKFCFFCCFGNTSRTTTLVSLDICYKIRVGSYSEDPPPPSNTGTITVTCLEGVDSNCCLEHDTPGCDDPGCEAVVCSCDPFCCGVYWDLQCVHEAVVRCSVCGAGG